MTKIVEKNKQKVAQKRMICANLVAKGSKKYLPFSFWKKQEEKNERNCKLFCV